MADLPTGALIVRNQSKGAPKPVIFVKFRDYARDRSPQVERRIGPGWLVKIGESGAKPKGRELGQWRERSGRAPQGFYTPDTARERAPQVIAEFYAEQHERAREAARMQAGGASVLDVADEWLAWRSVEDPAGAHEGWKHAHKKNMTNYAHRLAREIGEDRPVDSVTDDELLRLLVDGLRPMRNGKVIEGRETSRKMRATYSATLRGIFAFALSKGYAEADPAADLPSYRARRKRAGDPLRRHEYLTPTELRAVVAELLAGGSGERRATSAREQDAAMTLLMGMAGARPGEAVAILWEDVDFVVKVLRIVWSRTMGVTDTPKSHAGRAVPMADEVAEALAVVSRRDHMTAPGHRVFVGRDGGHVDLDDFRDRFHAAQDRAGISPRRDVRQLRNTFGTVCASAGVPLRTIQEWMGHESITTTEIYSSFMPRDQDAALVSQAFAVRTEAVAVEDAA
jgi:integrase